MPVEALSNENYGEFVAEKNIAVVLFYAQWEHYHPYLRSLLEAAVEEFNGQVNLGEVDVDACMDIAVNMSLKNVPTVVYYERGMPVESVIGVEANRNLSGRVKRMLAGAA